MAFKKAAPAPSAANVARMMQVGGNTEPATQADLSYLDNVTEVAPGGTIGSPVSEGNPDPSELHVDPSNVNVDGATAQPGPEGQPEQAAAPIEDEVDDPRFKGKSKREIFESYKNLESEAGRHRNEVGEYRRMFDQFVVQQANQNQQPQAQQQPQALPTDESELLSQLLTKPSQVLNAIEQKVVNQFKQQEAGRLVNQIKTENSALIQDPNFLNWLRSTTPPHIIQTADQDPSTLMFIINQFKSTTSANSNHQPAPAPRDIKVGVAAGTGQSAKPPAKVWTRTEIRNLITRNPDEYRARNQEIAKAYAEGRVKNE